MGPALDPAQILVPPKTIPPTTFGITVTTVESEACVPQFPLWITARNAVVCVSTPDVYVELVLEIADQPVNGLTALSQRITLPVCPLKVRVLLVKPEHIVVPPVTEPLTTLGVTLITTESVVAFPHIPLCTIVLNAVVWVNDGDW
jgi:hypothetical protein